MVVLLFGLVQMRCSAVSNAISDITSLDCDEWLQEEGDSTLNELCRDLEGYLDTDISSFTTAQSQAMPTADIAEEKRTYIMLTNSEGDPITDVVADDVTVEVSTDGGETYAEVAVDSVTNLADVTEVQASLGMLIDYSGSIMDSDLEDVNSGLGLFYDNTFPTEASSAYQSAVIKFSNEVTVVQDFTSSKTALGAAVDDTSYARLSTSLYDAIYDGVTEIIDEPTALNLLILFTDGVDNHSVHSKDEAIAQAVDHKVPVCVVGVGFADVSTLREIAEDTGCFFIYKTLFSDLDLAFEVFSDQINGFYVIDLDDAFSETTGILRTTIEVGEAEARVIEQTF